MARGKRDGGSSAKKLGDFTHQLPVKLSDEELLERGQSLAKLEDDLKAHHSHETSVRQELKAREASIEAERSRLAGIIRDRAEPREVKCERWAYYDSGTYEEVRTDTGEVLAGSSRPLRAEERQKTLPLADTRKPDVEVAP